MWNDIFNAILGLACLAVGGLVVRFLGSIDAIRKVTTRNEKAIARIEAHIGLDPYPDRD